MDGEETPLHTYPPPRVTSLGRSIFDPIWREQEHRGRCSELLHVLRGRVDLVMRDGTVHGREGDTIYTPARAPHRDVFPPNTEFEVYLVHFEWPGEDELLRRFTPQRLAGVSEATKAELSAEFGRLYRDFQRQGPYVAELTGARLLQIILTLCREAAGPSEPAAAKDQQSSRRHRLMARAKRVIQQRYAEPLALDDIAAELRISPYHLSHVFSAESGFTLLSYLTTVRMERAAELLKAGHEPIGAVATAVGFQDARYFSRVFRAHYGMAPSTYRAQPVRHADGTTD